MLPRMAAAAWCYQPPTRGRTFGVFGSTSKAEPLAGQNSSLSGRRPDQKPTLSSDGGKLAFMSWRQGGPRVFYLDLATGHQGELSTQPGGYWRPILSRDGSGVICNHGFLEFIPLSSLPRKVWE